MSLPLYRYNQISNPLNPMSIELTIPSVGESITEVQIAEWLKSEGDAVKKDENVAVIDSEKSTFELPAPEDGRLKILHQAGETVKIGTVVGHIETNGEPARADSGAKTKKEPETPAPQKKPAPKPAEEKSKVEAKAEKPAPAATAASN